MVEVLSKDVWMQIAISDPMVIWYSWVFDLAPFLIPLLGFFALRVWDAFHDYQ